MGMAVRTVDLQHAISISVVRASGRLKLNLQFPYQLSARPDHGRLTSGRLSLNWELALWRHASERETMSSGRLKQSSHICTWKESEA
jgi:hypothetical protein